jgi:hypothetical protein
MTRDEIDARILARMRREIDECIEWNENPLAEEADWVKRRTRMMWEFGWLAGKMLGAVAWTVGLVLAFFFLRIGLAGPLGMDVVTTEFWIGATILLGLFVCLFGREGRRG